MNTSEDNPEELLQGELLDSSGNIMMFEKIERANLKRIEVHNSYGVWAMYRADDDNFYIENHESCLLYTSHTKIRLQRASFYHL